jgi:hypothetical protein
VSLRTACRRARSLSAADYPLLVESMIVAMGLELALVALPFSKVRQWFGADGGSRAQSATITSAAYDRLTRFAAAPYRILPLPRTCLRESLVLCTLLNRRRIPYRLCLGVHKQQGMLHAHAWVECASNPLETRDPAFFELQPYRR